MPSPPKRKPDAMPLSEQLQKGVPDAGQFENIPKIRRIAGDSAGPYVPIFQRL